jgi:microcystin-dependent protein
MSEPFIGQIMMVGFNFPPRGWAKCDGQLLSISSNTALFSLLGTTFGGDGRTTFGLPDLRGRDAKHIGQGPGLANVTWGQKGGRENVTLTTNELPNHTHAMTSALTVKCNGGAGGEDNPQGHFIAPSPDDMFNAAGGADMAAGSVGGTITAANTGSGQAFNIENPYLGILHNIALVGIFPSRS